MKSKPTPKRKPKHKKFTVVARCTCGCNGSEVHYLKNISAKHAAKWLTKKYDRLKVIAAFTGHLKEHDLE